MSHAEEVANLSGGVARVGEPSATRSLHSLPHDEIIAKLDESVSTFRVLILKTNLRLP